MQGHYVQLSKQQGFFVSLRRYGRIIFALLKREELSRRAAPMESILNLLEPVVLITFMSAAWLFLGRRTFSVVGGSPLLFYATGFFTNYFFIYLSGRMRRSIDGPRRRFPIERRMDYIFVHILLRIIDYILLGLLLFGVIYIFFDSEALPYDLAPIVGAMAAIIALGFGWGILNLVMSKRVWLWPFFFPVFNRLTVMFSGVFFVPDFLPPNVREVMSFNPLLHAIILFRNGFYSSYPNLTLDVSYLAYCALAALVLGFTLDRITQRSEAE
jgi:capsular polysaccharide transport system permease protein